MTLANPEYYRTQARELRELAAKLIHAERDELLRIAQDYDLLAEKAERRNARASDVEKQSSADRDVPGAMTPASGEWL